MTVPYINLAKRRVVLKVRTTISAFVKLIAHESNYFVNIPYE